jgi:uncharacterized repeat protein (TIGR01451 family)
MKSNVITRRSTQKSGFATMLHMIILAGFLNAGMAYAVGEDPNPNSPVVIKLELKLVETNDKGKETIKNAPKVKPGDLVEYSAIYRNRSQAAITGLKATLPVPVGLQYVGGTAKPGKFEATIDGAKYELAPLIRTVKDADGKEQKEKVAFEEYRGLRWEVGTLDAGKKVTVKARMRVIDVPKTPEAAVSKPEVTATPAVPGEKTAPVVPAAPETKTVPAPAAPAAPEASTPPAEAPVKK